MITPPLVYHSSFTFYTYKEVIKTHFNNIDKEKLVEAINTFLIYYNKE